MTWPKIVLLAFYAAGILVTISTIGKPRKPMEPGAAAIAVLITGALAWLVVIA